MMKTITENFGTLYHPVKAFVVYKKDGFEDRQQDVYVESYDMDERGYPINAHPLSVSESIGLAKALDTSEALQRSFLKPLGLLPQKVLYINPDHNGYALWYTQQQEAELLFADSLGIPSGRANVPALLWKATRSTLHIYALKNHCALNEDTPLYHAPFFNVYQDGNVCMGTVVVNISNDCMLEEFMEAWEGYFFNSYFSHLFEGHTPVKGNIVQLWQGLVGSGKKFPEKSLKGNGLTIKNIIR